MKLDKSREETVEIRGGQEGRYWTLVVCAPIESLESIDLLFCFCCLKTKK